MDHLATGRFLTMSPASVLKLSGALLDLGALPVDLPLARAPIGIVTLKTRTLSSVAQLRLLYGLLIMGHGQRQILWLGVTTHPTAEWIANQLMQAYGWERTPRYPIRDPDACYGSIFTGRLRSLGIRDHPTSARSPWQNGYAERLIGSIRRECLDHVVVFGELHLRHDADVPGQGPPTHRAVRAVGRIQARPVLGGLHHQYARI